MGGPTLVVPEEDHPEEERQEVVEGVAEEVAVEAEEVAAQELPPEGDQHHQRLHSPSPRTDNSCKCQQTQTTQSCSKRRKHHSTEILSMAMLTS